jgi:acetolactate decarboxylase
MNRFRLPFFLCCCGALLAGCTGPSEPENLEDRDVLFQASTLEALLQGRFDGILTFGEVLKHGDFGVGTFDALEGEMIILDGEAFQVKADGVAYRVDGAATTPFAAVTFFDPDDVVPFDTPMDCPQLEAAVDLLLPDTDVPYAVKVEGTFATLTTRSVARQSRPYPGLADALAGQVEFPFETTQGTMVGFRLPPYMEGANVAGYHFHFLTDDRTAGGHVLACRTQQVQVSLDDIAHWTVTLPDAP